MHILMNMKKRQMPELSWNLFSPMFIREGMDVLWQRGKDLTIT